MVSVKRSGGAHKRIGSSQLDGKPSATNRWTRVIVRCHNPQGRNESGIVGSLCYDIRSSAAVPGKQKRHRREGDAACDPFRAHGNGTVLSGGAVLFVKPPAERPGVRGGYLVVVQSSPAVQMQGG
jgi:hypothetical protein